MTELTREQEWEQEKALRDREAVAALKAENLMAQWETFCAANRVALDAAAVARRERDRYQDMLAAALGVGIGATVTRTRKIGFGRTVRIQTQTFKVTGFKLYRPDTLTLWGRTVRKDGSLGEVFEIGQDWERAA